MNNAAALPAVSTSTPSKGLHVSLWVAQGLLATAFLMAGGMKVSAPIEQLQAQMPWVTGAMGGAVRFIGGVEVLGALGPRGPKTNRRRSNARAATSGSAPTRRFRRCRRRTTPPCPDSRRRPMAPCSRSPT